MLKKGKQQIKIRQFVIFLLAIIITGSVAFSLPITSYYLPALSESLGISIKHENQKYSLIDDAAVYITDGWEFYWNKLLITDSLNHQKEDLIVDLPVSWTTLEINGEKLHSGGVATYRKVIRYKLH